MNVSQILSAVVRLFGARLFRWGVNKGIGRMARGGGTSAAASAKQAKSMRTAVKRARQAARLARRLGR